MALVGMTLLDPHTAKHRDDIRHALTLDVANALRHERPGLTEPDVLASLITRHLVNRGWA